MTDIEEARGASAVTSLHPSRNLTRYLAALVVLGVSYYVGARLGLTLSLVESNVTPLWPPTGIALAAFILLGRSLWPGVAIAAFAVNLPISEGALAAGVTAVGNTLAPLAAAWLLERVGFRRQLDRRQDALAIVFVGALASTTISATVGSGTLAVSGLIGAHELDTAWLVWWTGDAMGILAVAPFLLALPLFRELPAWSPVLWAEAVAVLVLAGALALWTVVSDLQVLYLVLPVVGWASWRLQLRGAAPAALLVTLVVSRSAAEGAGQFAGETLFEQMFTLQTFNACVALTSFFLAAMVSERLRTSAALEAATAELEDRVQRRTAELTSANERLLQEIRERSEAEEQLSNEEARARREHEIAETLQRSLLPDALPRVPGVTLAARYVPASADMEVGGDWYDVIQLRSGLVGLAIGDVAGHGLHAAATMGQVRMALRAYAVQDPAPLSVMSGVHALLSQLPKPEMVTLIYLVFDPESRTLRFVNAGHPPPLVIQRRTSTFLEDGLSPPLGVTSHPEFTEAEAKLEPEATLLLYTDGLIERRRESIQVGLDRLVREATTYEGADTAGLCDHLLEAFMEPDHVPDDIAVVAMHALALAGRPFSFVGPAEPRALVETRRAMRQWLRSAGVAAEDEGDILVAGGEACANVVRHAYSAALGEMTVQAEIADGLFEMTVSDRGAWRAPVDRGGGWGLQLIEGLMDSVDVQRTSEGTVVRMRRQLRRGGDR